MRVSWKTENNLPHFDTNFVQSARLKVILSYARIPHKNPLESIGDSIVVVKILKDMVL